MQAKVLDKRWIDSKVEDSERSDMGWERSLEARNRLYILIRNRNVPDAQEIIKRLILPRLFSKDQERVFMESVLFDNKNIVRVEKGLESIRIILPILRRYEEISLDAVQAIEEIKKGLPLIKEHTPKLAQVISQAVGKEKKDPLLLRLNGLFSIGQLQKMNVNQIISKLDRIFQYLKVNYRYVIIGLQKIKRTDIGDMLRKFIFGYPIKRMQMMVIDEFTKALIGWKEGDKVCELINEPEKHQRELSLLAKLDERMIPLIKQLINYPLELQLFQNRLEMVRQVLINRDPDWMYFNRFYNSIEADAKRVRKEFGDEENADLLLSKKKELHEYPREWFVEIEAIIEKLKSSRVETARERLLELCEMNRIKIRQSTIKEVESIKRELGEELKTEIKKKPNSIIAFIKRMTKRTEKELRRRVDVRREQYREATKVLYAKYDELLMASRKVVERDFNKDVDFFRNVDIKGWELKVKEHSFISRINSEDPRAVHYLFAAVPRFAASERELEITAENRKKGLRKVLYEQLPRVLEELMKKIDEAENQLDKVLTMLEGIDVQGVDKRKNLVKNPQNFRFN